MARSPSRRDAPRFLRVSYRHHPNSGQSAPGLVRSCQSPQLSSERFVVRIHRDHRPDRGRDRSVVPEKRFSALRFASISNSVVASIACRRMSSDGARWVWIPLALLILRTYVNFPIAHTLGEHLLNGWNQFFGSNCGDTECLGQLFMGMPFVGSVAYAMTSVLVRMDARLADSSGAKSRADSVAQAALSELSRLVLKCRPARTKGHLHEHG